MKYKLRTTEGAHPRVLVDFEDNRYDLVGEMLLAERGLLSEMIKSLDCVLKGKASDSESFAGNAFSLYITRETTKITNDINTEETEAPTKALKKLIKVYKKHYDRIRH